MSGSVSLGGFPPVEERSRPDGAEEEAPDTNRTSGDDGDDEEVLTKKNNLNLKNQKINLKRQKNKNYFFFNLFRMMKLMKNMIPSRIDLKGSLQAKSCLGVPPRKGQDFLAMSTLKLIFDQANLLCEHYSQSLLYK